MKGRQANANLVASREGRAIETSRGAMAHRTRGKRLHLALHDVAGEPDTENPDVTPASALAATPDPLHGLARLGLWNLAATLVPGIYSTLLVAYLLRSVGPTSYAPWAVTVALLGWLSLLDLGLSQTTTREAARASAGDFDAIERVHVANTGYALMALVGLGLGLAFAFCTPAILHLSDGTAITSLLVGVFLAIDFSIVLASAGWMGVARGLGRFDLVFAANLVQVVVAVAVVVVLVPHLGIVGAAMAQPAGRMAGRSSLAAILTRRIPWFSIRPHRARGLALRALVAVSGPIMLMQLATQIGSGTDVIIVGAFGVASQVGQYAAGAQLVRYGMFLLFPLIDVVLPRFSAVATRSDTHVGDLLYRTVVLSGLVGAACLGFLAIEAPTAMRLWSGQSAELSVSVLLVYAATYVMIVPSHVVVLMLIARGQHALVALAILAEALVNVCLSVVLTATIGPLGPAISSLVVVTVDDNIVIPIIASRRLGLPAMALEGAQLGGILAGLALAASASAIPIAGDAGIVVRGATLTALLLICVVVTLRPRTTARIVR
jgi:O-antigen/teichoic acid export membrane protein